MGWPLQNRYTQKSMNRNNRVKYLLRAHWMQEYVSLYKGENFKVEFLDVVHQKLRQWR
jgi:hypothetical protein